MLTFFGIIYLLIPAFVYFGYLIYKSYPHKTLSAENKAIFITGCDSGFGFLLAKRMAELQYRVFAGCLFPEGDGAKSLQTFSSKIEVVALDVTNAQSVKEAAKTVEAGLGANDMLWAVVNNAGIGHCGEIEWSPMKTILKLFDVNTFGMVRVTQDFLYHLRKSKGRLVNLTSITGVRRVPSTIPYSMSKSAAATFSDHIRLEMAKWKIKVINIQPYFYSTTITSTDSAVSYLNNSWKNADSKNTSVLGNEYFENYVERCKIALKILNSDQVENVIRCLEDAIVAEKPKLYYRPGNLISKIIIDLPHLLPTKLKDYLQSYLTPRISESQ